MPAAIDPMAPKKPPIPDEDAAASAAFAAAVAWGAEASSAILTGTAGLHEERVGAFSRLLLLLLAASSPTRFDHLRSRAHS
jgi:hypothetical protein